MDSVLSPFMETESQQLIIVPFLLINFEFVEPLEETTQHLVVRMLMSETLLYGFDP